MQLQIAIASISILILSFGLDRYSKYLYQKALAQIPSGTDDSGVAKNAALKLRNKRLGILTLVVFIALFLLQCFNIDDAVNKQKDNKMKDLEQRIDTIEKFLWGGGGGNTGTNPPNPPGGPAHAMSLQARVEELVKQHEAIRKELEGIYPLLKVPAHA